MERSQIINQLEKINSPNNTVEIFLLGQPEICDGKLTVQFYKTRLQENIPSEIVNLFYPVIQKKVLKKEYTVKSYDPALMPDTDVLWELNSNEVPFYVFFNDLLSTKTDIEWYTNELLPYDDIWAYWIKVYGNGKSFYIIKKVTPSKVIKTGGKLALIFDSEIFKRLSDDVLTMDGSFDAIYFNQVLIFENKQNFEKALLYTEVKQSVAEDTLDKIGNIGFIENIDQVKDFLKDDYHSISKLNKIKGKPYFKTLSFASCTRIIKEYNVDVEIDEAKQQFNITSKQQAKYFIKVLNDDYLKSEMTNYKYSANSKEDI
jgi:hypothetical protein